MTLLLDLGNTRLKWARFDGKQLADARAFAWNASNTPAALANMFAHARGDEQRVLVASVAGPQREARIAEALKDCDLPSPMWLRTPAHACGVRNAYHQPHRLGIDRFLGLVAALHAGAAPCVVVSAGTALTLDALTADGLHLGGLIAPGPQLMQRALHEATAQLPPPADTAVLDHADSTEAAITSGCWQAVLALIKQFHARSVEVLGADAELLLSGGDAEALTALLTLPTQLQPDLVLHGLAVWDASLTFDTGVKPLQ